MKGRNKAVVAIVLVLSMFAAPALAVDLDHGEWDLDLYLEPCPDGRLLSWAGTFELGGNVYGSMAFPLVPTVFRGQVAHFQERLTVFELPDVGGVDALIAAGCDTDQVILTMEDRGYCVGAWCGGRGNVVSVGPAADPFGYVDASFGDLRVFWMGYFTGPTSFLGDIRLAAPR
jgi:hypothetical protein